MNDYEPLQDWPQNGRSGVTTFATYVHEKDVANARPNPRECGFRALE